MPESLDPSANATFYHNALPRVWPLDVRLGSKAMGCFVGVLQSMNGAQTDGQHRNRRREPRSDD